MQTPVILTLVTSLSLASLGLTANTPTAETLYAPLPAAVLPKLATPGKYAVGVSTITVTNPQQLNINTQQLADRPLTLEVWYPARLTAQSTPAIYANQTRTGVPFAIQGKAVRDSQNITEQRFPLVVLSHGYTGYRTIMYYLGEHLASHGYVVAAIDHTDSTHAEVDILKAPFAGFLSTLFNRSRDQQFVLDYFRGASSTLSQSVNTNQAAVIGFSMGGFGAINTVGGCYQFTPAQITAFTGATDPAVQTALAERLNSCAAGQYTDVKVDPAWQAAIAIAPWGGQHQLFNQSKLAEITTPMLYLAGDLDDISGYAGMQWLYENTGSKAKYFLTYHHARHNIAPHPAPTAAMSNELDIGTYHEGSWSVQTINTINKHFSLAMLDCHVKHVAAQCEYLQLPASITTETGADSGWLGFPARFATGLSWQFKS